MEFTKIGPTGLAIAGQELPTSRNFLHRSFTGFYPSSASFCRAGVFSPSPATRGWRLRSFRRAQAITDDVLGLSTAQTTSNGFAGRHREAKRGLLTRFSTKEAGRAVAALTSERAVQEWTDLESDVAYLTRSARLVQWYPGHIAKAEKKLKEQLQHVDVVLEVRDCRIPLATTHSELDQWIGDKMKILVLNREDMVTTADKNAWAGYYTGQGLTTIVTNGQRGSGIMKLERAAKSVAGAINAKRRAKGLLPRSVRAAVVGYPNVGKSSVINRLLKHSVCETAPRPGVTRDLRWTRIAEGLDLMDAPGVLPMRIQDQAAATRLAICNDIGEASYAVAGVASVLVEMLKRIPSLGPSVLTNRYKVAAKNLSGEEFMEELAQLMFHGDVNQAALRVLNDFRKGRFGWAALERPPCQDGSIPMRKKGMSLSVALVTSSI